MNIYLKFLIIFIPRELLATLIFYLMGLMVNKFNRIFSWSIFKGLIERAFLFVSLINDISQAITIFGALKIATRIKADDKISNEYFLVGNLVSISVAFGYYILWDKIF